MNTQEKIDFRNTEGSDLIRISKDFIVCLSDITNIELINEHPKTNTTSDEYPKYKVNLANCGWEWCIITIEDFNKYLKPFVLDLSETDL